MALGVMCTWKGCGAFGLNDQRDRDARLWARLCAAHRAEFANAIESAMPRKIVRAMILAEGGVEAVARKMVGR